MRHPYSSFLLTLGLALTGTLAVHAQALTNNGATITVSPGATLYVEGGYQQSAGSTTKTDGTMQVVGNVTSAGTLDLGTGELNATGNVTNTGTTQSSTGGTLRLTGNTNQNLDLNGGTVTNLVVQKSTSSNDTVRLVSNAIVTGTLTMQDGMMRTRATTRVELPNGATLAGETSGQYVQGNVRVIRTAVNGSSNVNFGNGAAINPGGNNLGQVTITRSAGLGIEGLTYVRNPRSGSTYKSIDRIWYITAQNQPAGGQPGQLTMSWLPDNDNGLTLLDFAQAAAWKREGTGPWVPASTYQNAQSRSLTVSVQSFSDWTVGAQNAPLPVEMLTFTAKREGSAARLDWTTASELNNRRFDVEMSLDGRIFRKIGEVAGQGTSTQQHEYRFYDPKLVSYATSLVYYRLRQVDENGDESVTEIRQVRVEQKTEFAAAAWPNPFTADNDVQVQVRTSAAGLVELTLFDAVGRLVSQHSLTVDPGTTIVSLADAQALPTGVYLLKVRQAQDVQVIRLTRE